jgi:hypothetical protein
MNYTKDDSQWPLVILTMEGPINDSVKFNELLSDWSQFYVKSSKEKIKFRLIVNVREMGKMDLKYILGIGQFLKKCKALTEKWMEKTAILVEKNSVVQTILDTVFFVYTPVRPFKVFNDIQKAGVWATNFDAGDELSYK